MGGLNQSEHTWLLTPSDEPDLKCLDPNLSKTGRADQTEFVLLARHNKPINLNDFSGVIDK